MHEITERHIAHARTIARRWRAPAWVEREELVGYAMLGLVKAARAYDPAKHTEFLAYVNVRVTSALMDGVRELSPLTRSQQRGVGDEFRRMYRAAFLTVQLDGEVRTGPDEWAPIAEVVADPCAPDPQTEADAAAVREMLATAREHLTPADQWTLHLRFDCEMTLAQIAEIEGVTECAISLRVKRALGRLQRQLAPHRDELALVA